MCLWCSIVRLLSGIVNDDTGVKSHELGRSKWGSQSWKLREAFNEFAERNNVLRKRLIEKS